MLTQFASDLVVLLSWAGVSEQKGSTSITPVGVIEFIFFASACCIALSMPLNFPEVQTMQARALGMDKAA